ncbi:MAG: sodium:solute symporter family protein [Candidatus Aegiribacteria sp.]|nr:sodium:solute symporter family protein [Candidatus Aegiribacteria sp.]
MNTALFWIVAISYSILIAYVGYRIKRGKELASIVPRPLLEFWMAGRDLPGWRLAISLTSGWLMLGWIGFGMSQVYMYGVTGLWILPIPWFILCLIIIFMVPLVRRIGVISLPQALSKRFGGSARILLAIFSFGIFISWTQAELFMAGTLASPFLGVPGWVCMIIIVIPILLYTWFGGFRAIVTTDLIQFSIMAVFMVLLATTAISAASNSTGGSILSALSQSAPPWAGSGEIFNPWFLTLAFPLVLLIGYLPGWMIEQDLLIRIQAAKSTKEARKGAVLGLLLITVFVLILPAIAAFCALIVFPPVNGVPPDIIGGDALQIISAFINMMPLAGALFMFLGLLACQMSTIDTFSNVSALAISHDIIEPMLRKRKFSGSRKLDWAKAVSMGAILFALACALISEKLGDVYYISSGILSACIAIPAMFIFWKRTTLPAVLASAVVGCIGTIGGYFYEYKILQYMDPEAPHYYANELPSWLQGSFMYNYLALGVIASMITIIVVSLITKKPTNEQLESVGNLPMDELEEFSKCADSF